VFQRIHVDAGALLATGYNRWCMVAKLFPRTLAATELVLMLL
jgi:hypothetical protein